MNVTTAARTRRPLRAALLLSAATAMVMAAGVAGAGGVAAQEVAPAQVITTTGANDEMSTAATRGFDVRNLSPWTLRLTRIWGDNNFDGSPGVGSELKPGQSQRYEVWYVWASNQRNEAEYDVLDGAGNKIGTFVAKMAVDSKSGGRDGRKTKYTGAESSVGATTHDEDSITLLDKPGTVHTITNGQQQAQTLNQWCAQDSQATCSLTIDGEQDFWAATHPVSIAYGNDTSGPVSKKLTISDRVGTTQSVKVNASVKGTVAGLFEAAVSTEYGGSWVNEHTFTDETTFTIQPGNYIYATATEPMTRYTGTFTMTLHNTTWILPGVWFDVPDTKRSVGVLWTEKKMTSDVVGLPSISSAPDVLETSSGDLTD